ncbi:MAG: ribosomal protein S18-alanine N-acetyltransferase [Aquificaceae bacterium]|nr:ribosomal protein S18-alanine N-acetyltransferase [Aquificaceae bacterium]
MSREDIEKVYTINLNCFGKDAWDKRAFEREFKVPNSRRWVLEIQDQVIGYCIIWIVADEAQIMSIAIDKAHQGKGLGKFLLASVLEKIFDEVKIVTLDVKSSNFKAIRLYQSFGFEMVSYRSRYYQSGKDAIQMELKLDETCRKAFKRVIFAKSDTEPS